MSFTAAQLDLWKSGEVADLEDPTVTPLVKAAIHTNHIGQAARHLVLSRLSLEGLYPFEPSEGCKWDVGFKVGEKPIVRIQVKGSKKSGIITFGRERRGPGGSQIGLHTYNGHADYIAFVMVSKKIILFSHVSEIKTASICFKSTQFTMDAENLSLNNMLRSAGSSSVNGTAIHNGSAA